MLDEKWVTGNTRLAEFDRRIMSQNIRHNADMPAVAFKRQPASHLPSSVPAHEFECLLWQSIPALGINAKYDSGTVSRQSVARALVRSVPIQAAQTLHVLFFPPFAQVLEVPKAKIITQALRQILFVYSLLKCVENTIASLATLTAALTRCDGLDVYLSDTWLYKTHRR